MGINLKHPAIKKANSASADEIRSAANLPAVLPEKTNGGSRSLKVLCASDLSNELREQIWLIFEENMKTFYSEATSISWDPESKKKEMFHALARFILLQPPPSEVGGVDPPVDAFCIFRFEREHKRNMLYCYELQVRTTARRLGLGKILLEVLGKIGNAYSIPRILLTAFTANHEAFRFYEASGFVTDITSPSPDDGEGDSPVISDYVILCKNIDQSMQ